MKKIILGGISAGCFVLIVAGSALPEAASVPGFSMSYTGTASVLTEKQAAVKRPDTVTALRVLSPADKSIVYTKQCTIKGEAPATEVRMNKTKVSVDKKGKFTAVTPLQNGRNEFTFSDGTGTARLQVLKLPGFSDINVRRSSKQTIEAVALLGYFGDITPSFRPDQPILRGEMAMACAKLAELPRYSASQMSTPLFKDVSAKTRYGEYIYSVGIQHLMPGDVDGKFYPANKITRAKALVLIVRAAKLALPEGQSGSPFKDVPDRHFAVPALVAAQKAGVIEPAKTFSPDKFATRADVALWLSRTPKVKKEMEDLFTFADKDAQ